MLKKQFFSAGSEHKRAWIVTLACVISLGAAACGGIPANALTPTPTPLLGYVQPQGQSGAGSTEAATEAATETPGSNNGDEEDLVDICALITEAEAAAVLGQPVTEKNPGVDSESDSGGTLYFCSYLGTGRAVLISLVDMGDTQTAGDELQRQLAVMIAEDAGTTSTQVNGPGDQAYWSTAEHAAGYTIVKDQYVFSVLIGGDIGEAEAYKTSLYNLAVAMAERI